jgi:DNA processing protein
VVVEAAEKSGALITARLAIDLGLDVFAVPGDLDRATSAGTNRLIRDGAHPVTSIEELSEALELGTPRPPEPVGLDIEAGEALTIDQLAARHPDLPVAEVMATVSDLEVRGRLLVDGGLIEVPRWTGGKS